MAYPKPLKNLLYVLLPPAFWLGVWQVCAFLVDRRLEGRVVLPDGHRDLLRGPHHVGQQLKAVSKKVLPADLIGLLGALRRVQAHVPGVQLGAQVLIAQG